MQFFPQTVSPAKRRAVGIWLLVLVGMVFVTVILGGFTRLTGSGLSMVNWQPITGWLPPLNDAQWQAVFDLYRQTPQYRHVNYDMTLDGFHSIFWLEYVHRVWGRLIGVAFIVPFAWFVLRGSIDRRLIPRIGLLFVLGGLQGAIGWFMVSSGLVDAPDVSQYRLVAHLGAAMLIYGYMLWLGLTLAGGRASVAPLAAPVRSLARATSLVVAWIALTMLAGGFVAGLDAGFTYNTFPLMDGQWIPAGAFAHGTAPFDDIATVQFDHRVMAVAAVVLVLALWARARGTLRLHRERAVFHALAVVVVLQAALGIVTLLLVVPTPLGAAHQALAFVLLGLAVWARHGLQSNVSD